MPRLMLRRLTIDDLDPTLDNVMTWINDREVTKNLARFNHVYTREEEREYLQTILGGDNDRLYEIRNQNNEYVGQIGIHQIYWPARHGRAGTVIVKEHQRKRYGLEANILVLEEAFKELNKVWAKVFADNPTTNRMVQTAGYTRVGTLRDEYVTGDKPQFHDMGLYEILKREYDGRKEFGYYDDLLAQLANPVRSRL
jgi:RimJ/RimL family protein N-acetyltransferase